MFSDKVWLLKVAAAVGLLAWLGTRSHGILSELHPELERAALFSQELRGRTLYLWARRVEAVDATGFEIGTRVGPMRVLSRTAPPPKGSYVTLLARVVAPRTLEASTVHVNEGFIWKRPLNYGISILTVIGYLWLVRGRFRCRIEDGVLRSRC